MNESKRQLNILTTYFVEKVINQIDNNEEFSYGYLYDEIYANRVKAFTIKFKPITDEYYPARLVFITKKFILVLARNGLEKEGK